MVLRKGLLSHLAMLALVVVCAACAVPANATMPDFAVGQIWSIKSASPTTAKVVIGRIEEWGHGETAIHVSIIDIPIPQGAPGAGGVTRIDHVPFDKSALTASVDQLLTTGAPPAPGFEGGYDQWHSDKRAGVFTVSVSKAIDLLFESAGRRELIRVREG